jgi:hypothetical protein
LAIWNQGKAQLPAKEIVDEFVPGIAIPEHKNVRPGDAWFDAWPRSAQTTAADTMPDPAVEVCETAYWYLPRRM